MCFCNEIEIESILKAVYKDHKKTINNPNWEIVNNEVQWEKYVHDWESYILDEFKMSWDDLSNDVKTALYMTGLELAENEEWD